MTRAEWLASDDPAAMINWLENKGHGEKLWDFTIACCRRIWNELPGDAFRRLVEHVERIGTRDVEEPLAEVWQALDKLERRLRKAADPDKLNRQIGFGRMTLAFEQQDGASAARSISQDLIDWAKDVTEEKGIQAEVLRRLAAEPLLVGDNSTDESWWLTCTSEPVAMLELLEEKATPRKLRLFACACCRRVWHLLPDKRSRQAVERAEQFADANISDAERVLAAQLAAEAMTEWRGKLAATTVQTESGIAFTEERSRLGPLYAASAAAWYAVYYHDEAVITAACDACDNAAAAICDDPALAGKEGCSEDGPQCELVRCIFGNPFRPVHVEPSWQTEKVISLARRIYDDRAFERIPELGTALQEAGCREQAVLAHCQPGSLHARGCWLLDLLLEKA